MRDGKVLTLNETDLYEEARDRATSLVQRAGLEQSPWPRSGRCTKGVYS